MKRTTTEILIEVEELIYVKCRAAETQPGEVSDKDNAQSFIDVCPHCYKAIFITETENKKTEGDSHQ